jgi:hypothetical protein
VVNKITRTMKNAAVAAAEELGRLHTDAWIEHVKQPDPDGKRLRWRNAYDAKHSFKAFRKTIRPGMKWNWMVEAITIELQAFYEAFRDGKRPNRRPDAVNRITKTMKNAAVAAAEELGRLHTDEWIEHVKLPDPDGMKHYFKVLAVHEKRVFAMFLARIMPLNVETNTTQQLITHQQMLERLKAGGLPLELIDHMRFVDADDLDPDEYEAPKPYSTPDETDDEGLVDVTNEAAE